MQGINDKGPIYKETDPSRFPVDRLATITNLGFLATFAYWAIRIAPEWQEHLFLSIALIPLLIGWAGGTMYHATRKKNIWLAMDILPIIILCIAVTIYLWTLLQAPWYAAALTLIIPAIAVTTTKVHSTHKGALIGYSTITLPILLPIAFLLKQQDYAHWHLITGALISFLIAIAFRTIDHHSSLERGTHWLWHLFGAAATFMAINYLYLI